MPDLTFLMNADAAGSSNQFYTLAKKYFVDAGSTVIDAPARGQTIEGIIAELKKRAVEQKTVNIVSHAIGFGGMQGAVTVALRTAGHGWTLADDLQDALAAKSVAPPGTAIVTDKTRLVLYGCDVGRSTNFVKMLSHIFGWPGELLAPRRMGVFKQAGRKVKYRQAQSWTLARKAPLLAPGTDKPAGGWPAYRAQFVKDASLKFGRAAILAEMNGDTRLDAILKATALNATAKTASTFFIAETLPIIPTGTQTPAEAAASVKPISNGDPVTAAPQSAEQVDDTTVVTTVGPADTYPVDAAKTRFVVTTVLLGRVMDEDVLIAEGPAYRRLTSVEAGKPSTGPKPTSGGGGSGGGSGGPSAFDEQLRALLDELLAGGAAQADVEAILAAVPQGDATETLVMEVPDEPPVPDDLASLALPPEEVV